MWRLSRDLARAARARELAAQHFFCRGPKRPLTRLSVRTAQVPEVELTRTSENVNTIGADRRRENLVIKTMRSLIILACLARCEQLKTAALLYAVVVPSFFWFLLRRFEERGRAGDKVVQSALGSGDEGGDCSSVVWA